MNGAMGSRRGPVALARGAARRVLRVVLALPLLPDGLRLRLARWEARGLSGTGRTGAAIQVLARAADRTRRPSTRADLLGRAARLDLDRGRVPPRLADAIRAEGASADVSLRRGNRGAAASSLARAMALAFSRVLHYDRTDSPMSADPRAFLAPLHGSEAFAAMTAGAGRTRPVAEPPRDRPLRLLFLTHRNDQFLAEIRDRYEHDPRVEVRSFDVVSDPALAELIRSDVRMAAFRLGADPAFGQTAEARLRTHLDWADTVFVDWCTGGAVLATAIDPGTTRIVIRLHSVEAFSRWTCLTDFTRVDDVVFVSAHLRDLSVEAVQGLRRPDAPALHVIHNAMALDRYARPKGDDARHAIGMVGISSVAKDVRWALSVLELLRAEDDRYRLVLIGSDVDGSLSPAAREYAEAYTREVTALEAEGAVRRLGQLSDVSGALAGVGVILSASVRESFHCGLVEGAASGAVPVVRDWPFFAGKANGARTLFPAEWVVGTPQEAADRIRAVTATDEDWRAAGRAAAALAIASWDWPVVAPQFDELLLRGGQEAHAGPTPKGPTATP